MVRRAFVRGLRSHWLGFSVGIVLIAVVLTACGGHRTVLATQTAVAATGIAPTASPTPYATAPGGNVTPATSVAATPAASAMAGAPGTTGAGTSTPTR